MSASIPTPNTAPQARHYSLQVLRFDSATAASKTPNLYAKVRLGDDPDGQQTPRTKGGSHNWNTKLVFSSSDISTRFNIRVKYEPTSLSRRVLKKSNPCIGSIDISIADLLEKSSGGEVRLDLHPPDGRREPTNGTIVLYLRLERTDRVTEAHAKIDAVDMLPTQTGVSTIADSNLLSQNDSPRIDQPINTVEDVRIDIDNTISAIRQRGIASSAMGKKFAAIGDISSQLGEHSDVYKSLWALCNKIGFFADAVNRLAVAHPYLNAAWQVSSSLFRVVEKKFENDQSIVELVCTASNAFDIVCEIEGLPNKVESLQRFIIGLLTQTTELCIFIRHYTSRGLVGLFVDLINSSQKIEEFKESFRKIEAGFTTPLALHAAFVSARISEKVDTIYLRQELEPDDKAATGRPRCLPGTRVEILDSIANWMLSDSEQTILWLHGVAGSGKSTISMTIAEQCLSLSRRGAYMFFEREKSDPNTAIRTIAFWVASFHHTIAKHVSEAVKANNGIGKAALDSQFDKLLLQPLQASMADMVGPVVIILDALDECGPPASRQELLKLLAEKIPELPHNFRFIITSRREGDIEGAFSKMLSVYRIKLDHDSVESRRDVTTFFAHEMEQFFSRPERKQLLPEDWPWDANIQLLANTAGGLFIWASTSAKHISESDLTAFPRLERLVKDIQSRGHAEFGLDALYSSVLQCTHIPWDDKETSLRFSNILYLILEVGVALSTDDIDGILGLPPHISSIHVISRLQSVLDYTPGSTSRIHPLHASFAEFLKSEGQSQKPWYINIANKREYIAKRCHESFNRMERMLRFNICGIGTSFTTNDCIPDLQRRLKQNIAPELENACLYWIQQLRILPYSLELLSQLDHFLHKNLLSWLEVLSLMGKVDLAISVLMDAYKWVTEHNASIGTFLLDARKLIIAFDAPISKSTPHIYLSMIPLAWADSEVAAHYSRAITSPNMAVIVGNRSQRAPPTEYIGHNDRVNCISYSSDGKRIASGSRDRTVIVWDAESGEVVAGPFKGHADEVNSVGFSPDGKYVVSGSSDKSVIIWNAESGEVLRGPFEGHSGAVNCVSFSPDGKHVVSGSDDSTIKVWKVESGKAISTAFERYSGGIYAAAYSPDGKYIVSGSDGGTLRVWGGQSGETIKGPLEGHTGAIHSAMFSPDGKRLVSGSDDNTIWIWDLESGKLVVGPLKGHIRRVIFVGFSADGKHIFSGSWDDTMKVWDAKSGEIISSMVGEYVYSVSFAPNGKRVASGSEGGTIQVFDVQANKDAPESFEGHTGGVSSIEYSPDGKHIVSGSGDKTLIVWDMESGKIVAGPFKGHKDMIRSVAYSADGKRILFGSHDKTLIVWDAGTGKIISGPLTRHTNWVLSVGFSPNGKQVVSGSRDKTIIVWEVESGTIILGPLEGHSGSVYAVGFSPDGKYIVSGSYDKTIRVWGAEKGEVVLTTFEGHSDGVNSVAYSPDGRYIVSGSDDKTVIVWHAERGVILAGPFDRHTGGVRSVRFSLDGKYVVSGSNDKTIILWEVESGKVILGPLKGHGYGVSSVRITPDGRHIASGSWDDSIRVWDVENAVAPMTSTEGSIHQNWTLSKEGWVLGQEGELLLWIPSDMHSSLWLPRYKAFMSSQFVTKLLFTEHGIGKNWDKCFDSRKLIVE